MSQSITFGDLDSDKRRELEEHALKIIEDPKLWPFSNGRECVQDFQLEELTQYAYIFTVALNKIQDLASTSKIKQARSALEQAKADGVRGDTNDGKKKTPSKPSETAQGKGKTLLGVPKAKSAARQKVLTMFCLAGLDKEHMNYLNLPDKDLLAYIQAKYSKGATS